jgi:organic radical activating enzyme
MNKKTWPINIDPTCQLKWTWSTIYLTNSASASCHRTRQYPFTLETFDDFHNLPGKLADRQKMLDGKWPGNGCQYCKKIEDAGGYSDRMVNDSLVNITPTAVLTDPTAVSVVPKMVEVYFDNTCDLKCAYCGPWYSSLWAAENKKFGYFRTGTSELTNAYQVSENRRAYVEKFWAWWDRNYSEVTHFQFLGGEPFYQKEFDEFVDFVGNHSNPDLWINITSNLNCETDRLIEKIQKFKKFVDNGQMKALQIVGSIDCWGPQQEHIRFPLDLARWERNFEYLVEQDWIVLNINSAISSLSIKTMPDLLRKLAKWREKRAIWQNFMTIQDPMPLNPDYLGGDVFADDFKEIIAIMERSADGLEEGDNTKRWYLQFAEYMRGIAQQVASSQPNVLKLKELHDYLNELDRRRGTRWPRLYPWLINEFERHNIK